MANNELSNKIYNEINDNSSNLEGSSNNSFFTSSLNGWAMLNYLYDMEVGKEELVDRYWVAFDRSRGYEIRGFPNLIAQEVFTREIILISIGELYQLFSKPDTTNKLELESRSQCIMLGGKDNEDKKIRRLRDKNLHESVKTKIRNVRNFTNNSFYPEFKALFSSGFQLYHSSWGETFVPVNNEANLSLREVEEHESGTFYSIKGNKFYPEDSRMNFYNYAGFNVYNENQPSFGIISDNGEDVGIYIEMNSIGAKNYSAGNSQKLIGNWSYKEFGKDKMILLKPEYIDNKLIINGEVVNKLEIPKISI